MWSRKGVPQGAAEVVVRRGFRSVKGGFFEGVGRSGRQEGVWSRKRGSLGCVLGRLDVKKVCGVGKGVCGAEWLSGEDVE